jgi:sulfur-oxidizing protein SoxA
MRWLAILAPLMAAGLGFTAQAEDIAPANRLSGYEMMGSEAQAMQRDDFANPAMLAVREGERLWSAPPAEGKASCRSCHGDASVTMRGVAARYPAWDRAGNGPIDLTGRIQQCQSERQGIAPSPRESGALLALQALVALQSRGMPIAPPEDPRLASALERGERLFRQRLGQLDLSCAQCHSRNWGKSLGGTRIPQAHPTGYPLFRMEWQATGSLHRRLRNCLTGIRAEPFPAGSPEMIEIELFLMHRASGMAMDAPAVRP